MGLPTICVWGKAPKVRKNTDGGVLRLWSFVSSRLKIAPMSYFPSEKPNNRRISRGALDFTPGPNIFQQGSR